MEEKHYKRIINQVSGYVREICQQMTQTVPKAVVTCMVVQVRAKKSCFWWQVVRLLGSLSGVWEGRVKGRPWLYASCLSHFKSARYLGKVFLLGMPDHQLVSSRKFRVDVSMPCPK